jgi:hypothetical protein
MAGYGRIAKLLSPSEAKALKAGEKRASTES